MMKKRLYAGLTILALCLSLCPAVLAAGGFTDVASDAWYCKDVTKCAELGLMGGKGGGKFAPDDQLTRAEAMTIAVRVFQRLFPGDEVRAKLPEEPWYRPYDDFAREHGIIPDAGGPETTPEGWNQSATRMYFVTLLGFVPPSQIPEVNSVPDGSIPDVSMAMEGAETVYSFYRAGVLAGSDARGYFNPESCIRRSEIAAILARVVDDSARKHFSLGASTGSGLSEVCAANGAYCAVAFLGTDLDDEMTRACYRQDLELLDKAKEVEHEGFQYFFVAPGKADYSIKVSEWIIDEEHIEGVMGKTLFTGGPRQPVIVHCNVSDEFPNTIVQVLDVKGGVLVEYNPCLSMENGKLFLPEGIEVYDYTSYGVG